MNYYTSRLILLLLLLPFFSQSQTGRADDSLRVMADTMHFPSPFQFTVTRTSQISGAKLFNKCSQWADGIGDSLKAVTVRKYAKGRKIIVSNVPATADISCMVTIVVKGKTYTCSLTSYMFHPVNGGAMPVDKAAAIKSNQPTVNIEKLLISRNYQNIFLSLENFITKTP